MKKPTRRTDTSVWYFVAATFVFAAPMLFFRDATIAWLPLVALGAGLGIFVLGVRVFMRERRAARAEKR